MSTSSRLSLGHSILRSHLTTQLYLPFTPPSASRPFCSGISFKSSRTLPSLRPWSRCKQTDISRLALTPNKESTGFFHPRLHWPRANSRSYSSPIKAHEDPNSQQSIINQYRARQKADYEARNRTLLLYAISLGVVTLGLSYAAVPLYRVFCSVTGYNGTPQTNKDGNGNFAADRIAGPVGEKLITVRFNADKSDTLDWKFWPCQKFVKVRPGETVLAFYKAKNLSDVDVLGVATYNVTPGQVAPYFAKVECFCFDEQRLLAGEEVDLPIFFFLDKDFVEDPLMKDIDDIVLSYTFFKARRNSFGHIEPDTPPEKGPPTNPTHGISPTESRND